ncbi:hypothetical protein FFF93_000955 [Arthrobacter sp. KBS0702]|jgi:hypothetical protein|uniref:hypothetical protein n=1 Tax=Arthrobacter sp. KBS0702 TaxID=2578107 RepID=UPI00110E40AF|nr:hypothetical protein [Arthrobacter sp. KBS0702]QDW28517.1 hypothetical protein FFF93_000955 [Arthrobacter sp. KBS0702]
MTDKNEPEQPGTPGAEEPPAAPTPEKGLKSRLTDAQKEMLASKSRGGAGLPSVGRSHKPTHASGKQGPAQKKVRW